MDESLYQLTTDHSLVQTPIGRGELTVAQVETDPRKNAVNGLSMYRNLIQSEQTVFPTSRNLIRKFCSAVTGYQTL